MISISPFCYEVIGEIQEKQILLKKKSYIWPISCAKSPEGWPSATPPRGPVEIENE